MKHCVVDVSIDANNRVQKEKFGNQWKDGSTTLILKPLLPYLGGFWDSNRSIDIDSAAGSEHAFYMIESGDLHVKTGGYDGDQMRTTHLKLNDFTTKVGEVGDGTFYFRNREWEINWEVTRYD